jgi:hypothetical protein
VPSSTEILRLHESADGAARPWEDFVGEAIVETYDGR